MYKATDILKGINAEVKKQGYPLSPIKKQKLLYYCQAWSLVWTGRPLYSDEIQAWDNGPVVPSARHYLTVNESVELPQWVRAIIAAIVAEYGVKTGQELSDLTHQEKPWLEASEQGRNTTISSDAIRRYYSEQSFAGNSPKKPYLELPTPSDEEYLAAAEKMATRWSKTLELLGR